MRVRNFGKQLFDHSIRYWLLIALIGLALWLVPLPQSQAAAQERVFQVEAASFEFRPGTLRVNPGDRVRLEVAAQDVVHGLYVDGYRVSVQAEPGQTAVLSFVADRPGTFRLRCSVPCGPLHPFMIAKLQVGYNWLPLKALGLSVLAVLAVLWKGLR